MKLVVDGHARLADAHTSPSWLGRSRSRGLGLVDVHGPIVKPIDRFASFIGPSAAVRVLLTSFLCDPSLASRGEKVKVVACPDLRFLCGPWRTKSLHDSCPKPSVKARNRGSSPTYLPFLFLSPAASSNGGARACRGSRRGGGGWSGP